MKKIILMILLPLLSFASIGVKFSQDGLAKESGNVNVQITNNFDVDIEILKWNTPLEKRLNADIFNVNSKDKTSKYVGRKVKRAKPRKKDYVLLEAGESIEAHISLPQYYKMETKGDYTVEFSGFFKYRFIGEQKSQPTKRLKNASSITISFTPSKKKVDIHSKQQAQFVGCTDTEKTVLNTAHDEAVVISKESLDVLNNAPARSEGERYKTWFGSADENRKTLVTANFNKIYDAFENKNVSFNCSECKEEEEDYSNIYAYVYPDAHYTIVLCGVFWQTNTEGSDTQAGTLIHEMSHFTIIGSTQDYVYGHDDAKELASTEPIKATNNAENYEYFAENNPKLEMDVATTTNSILALNSGWNLVGANSSLSLSELKTKIGTDNLLVVQGQNKTYQKSYEDEGKDFLNNFLAFEAGKGYWIKVNSAVDIEYSKIAYNSDETINLIRGWNLINPFRDLNKSEIFAQLGSTLESIQGQDNLNGFKTFEEPKGYWIKVSSDATLNFPVVETLPTLNSPLSTYLQKMKLGIESDSLWSSSSTENQTSVQIIVNDILNKNYLEAHIRAKTLNGEVLKVIDGAKTYYVLHLGLERLANDEYKALGGTYVFYPAGKNSAIQVPHPVFDTNTDVEGIETFLGMKSKYLLISGTHRKSSDTDSTCQSSYKESDASHNTEHYFFNVHKVLSEANSNTLFIELHGFGSSTRDTLWSECDSSSNVKLINISEGTGDKSSIEEKSFMHLFHKEISKNTDIKSCIYSPTQNSSSSDVYSSSLGGTTNVSGRFTNGVESNVCSTSATTSSHRFIHLEQSYEVRQNEREAIIDALKVAMSQLDINSATLTTTPTSTSAESVSVEVNGKVGATVWVNGTNVGTIGADGKLIISLDTSGEDGTKSFSIILKDANNNASAALLISIEKTTLDDATAIRFLNKATFGATTQSIEELKNKGVEKWIDEQLAMPLNDNQYLIKMIKLAKKMSPEINPNTVNQYLADNDIVFNKEKASFDSPRYRMSSWFDTVLMSKDQLRQKVTYALSQIIVESDFEPIFTRRAEALANYFDILQRHAFGTYEGLLNEISLSSGMGVFLTFNGSKKEYTNEANTAIYPDENYAREVMQLFSMGIMKLNLNGTPILDAKGNPVPTYTQEDVNQLARVFTGWDLKSTKFYGRVGFSRGDYTHPLEFTASFHDNGEKKILGDTIASGIGAENEIKKAISIIMSQNSVAPYIAKNLIMRLTKSNPTTGYIQRVASVFQSTNGDLKAVTKAIFLDEELWNDIENKTVVKFKEPVVAYTSFLRAFNAKPFPKWYYCGYGKPSDDTASNCQVVENSFLFNDLRETLNQAPGLAPTVFNFYDNDFIPNSTAFKTSKSVAPEIQIQSDSVFINLSNTIRNNLFKWEKNYLLNLGMGNPKKRYDTLEAYVNDAPSRRYIPTYYVGANKMLLDVSTELDVMEKVIDGNTNGDFINLKHYSESDGKDKLAVEKLVSFLNLKLTGGLLTQQQESIIANNLKDRIFRKYNVQNGESVDESKYNKTRQLLEHVIFPAIRAVVTSNVYMTE